MTAVELWFEKPTQAELRSRLAVLDAERHAAHRQPAWFCPLCPAPRGTAHPQTPAAVQEGEALPAAGLNPTPDRPREDVR